MKKTAYTLAEVMLVIIILGFLALVITSSLKFDRFESKEQKTSVIKVLDEFNIANAKIRDLEKVACPFGVFVLDVAGTKEFALYKKSDGTTLAETADVMALYEEYIKLDRPQSDYYDFCDYTGWASCTKNKIKAARLTGEIYVGIQVNDNGTLESCPNYYRISTEANVDEENSLITPDANEKICWGKLYIDINGKKIPNEIGKDIFIYGLSGAGIVY